MRGCSSSPCQHAGTCIELITGYYCSCQMNYSGDYCEISTSTCGVLTFISFQPTKYSIIEYSCCLLYCSPFHRSPLLINISKSIVYFKTIIFHILWCDCLIRPLLGKFGIILIPGWLPKKNLNGSTVIL